MTYGPVIPGQTQGTTPPFFPQQDDRAKQILEFIMKSASQRRFAGQPRPAAVPGLSDPAQAQQIGLNTSNPHGWGAERFMGGLQAMMRNAVAMSKERQINKAMADWDYAQSSLNEYYSIDQQDQNAVQQWHHKYDWFWQDEKKLKNMAKSLNQDWLNPEKTTVHGEALKRKAAQVQETSQKKNAAATGIRNMFKSLLGRQQQVQLSPEEQRSQEQEIIGRAPTTSGLNVDISSLRSLAEIERSISESRQKYQLTQPGPDGTVFAVNKNDPRDAHKIRDTETGDEIRVGKTQAKEGQVYTVNSIPLGVFHKGKPVQPGDEGWTDSDAKLFSAAVDGLKEKQNLRVDPAIVAIVGDPPLPTQFAKGRSDPAYKKALEAWGRDVFQKEIQKASVSGEARAIAWNKYRPVEAMDDEGNVYYTTAAKAIEEGMASAGHGIDLKSRQSQIKDIETASDKTREAILNVDRSFDVAQIAKLKLAMTTDDPTLARTEMQALASQNLTEKQQDFVIWVNQLNERAMSLRKIAGQGAGAQDLRDAIRAMLPGVGSGSTQMMTKQLDAFDQQVKVLKGGIAKPGRDKSKSDHPSAKIPDGWSWIQKDGKWGITDGKGNFRPYLGK